MMSVLECGDGIEEWCGVGVGLGSHIIIGIELRLL